jgi:hypothetical protein
MNARSTYPDTEVPEISPNLSIGTVNPPGTAGGPERSAGRMDYLFHELHPDGRHALCAVCRPAGEWPQGSRTA